MEVSQRAPTAQPRPVAWNALLRPLGVTIRSDMAYDLLANEVIPLPTDFGRVLQVYPFFIRAQSTRSSPVNQDLGGVVLTWASTIDTTGAAKGTLTPLLGSSQATGTFTNVTTIAPTQDFPQTELQPAAAGGDGDASARRRSAGKPRGRVVVVGSLDFATDRFVRTAPENLAFTLNAVDWLAQDEALIAIRSKDRRPPPLLFESPAVREGVKYANLIGLPLLVGLVGVIRLVRRRRRTREPYRPLVPAAGERGMTPQAARARGHGARARCCSSGARPRWRGRGVRRSRRTPTDSPCPAMARDSHRFRRSSSVPPTPPGWRGATPRHGR